MPKSLHLIHKGKKERGDLPKRWRPTETLAEARRRVILPYKAEHLDMETLKKALDQLNVN